jgi:hypothetical protein
MPCIGGDQTNQVFFDDVFVADEYMVGREGHGFRYISEALDLERFTMFTYSPIQARFELLCEYVRTAVIDGQPLREDPVVRQKIAQLATQHEVARVLGLRFLASCKPGAKPPTVQASQYKLYATQLSQRAANAALDIGGAASQLCLGEEGAPGGGASEIQKNIIARRGLGLPKNF